MASSARRASKSADVDVGPVESLHMRPKSAAHAQGADFPSSSTSRGAAAGTEHGDVEYNGPSGEGAESDVPKPIAKGFFGAKRPGMFAYVKTKEFWLVLLLGYVISAALKGAALIIAGIDKFYQSVLLVPIRFRGCCPERAPISRLFRRFSITFCST